MEKCDINSSSSGLPTRYVALGDEFVRYGVRLVCIGRPPGLLPTAGCKGCWFNRSRSADGNPINCNDIQCSSWDRMDGRNVWFVDKEDLYGG